MYKRHLLLPCQCPGRWRTGLSALALACLALPVVADPVAFLPQFGAHVATAPGADARFVQIDSNWRGSTVLWNEATRSYGSGQAIGSFGWGTGLWGQADWHTIQQTATGVAAPGAPAIVNRWTGQVSTVSFGNADYNLQYGDQWGRVGLLPFFDDDSPAQDNWVSRFSGVIRVDTPGAYDFSVLNDDGFFLRLLGGQGQAVEIGRDFLNPRERTGLADLLWLSEGLYGFELGAWNRLQAGVVDLRWLQPGGSDWTLVPVQQLAPARAVPAPGTLGSSLLALLALAALAPLRRCRVAASNAASKGASNPQR